MRIKLNVDLEAKDCPFCGKPPIFYFDASGLSGIRVRIQCPDRCASRGEDLQRDHYGYYTDIESACERLIKKWNARVKE